METTVDKLEALVRKAESDLQFLTCKLEHELSIAASKDMEKQLNPIKILEELEEVKRKYGELFSQYQELQKSQKEAYDSLSEDVHVACKVLMELEEKAGVPISSTSLFTPIPNKRY